MIRVRSIREGTAVTHLLAAGSIVGELTCLAWILHPFRGRRANARQRPRERGIRARVRHSGRPLLYTAEAAEQRARLGLNVELVETALALPTVSGALPGAPLAWYAREFGNKRITVWATNCQVQRAQVIIRIEATPTNP